jgi:hypothetical protein
MELPFKKGMPPIQIAGMVVSVWMIEDNSRNDEVFLENDDIAGTGMLFLFKHSIQYNEQFGSTEAVWRSAFLICL